MTDIKGEYHSQKIRGLLYCFWHQTFVDFLVRFLPLVRGWGDGAARQHPGRPAVRIHSIRQNACLP